MENFRQPKAKYNFCIFGIVVFDKSLATILNPDLFVILDDDEDFLHYILFLFLLLETFDPIKLYKDDFVKTEGESFLFRCFSCLVCYFNVLIFSAQTNQEIFLRTLNEN